VTEKAAAVYQRGRWLVSNVSDVRIMWNITTQDNEGEVKVKDDIPESMKVKAIAPSLSK
jgi:hypothetical protein